MHNFVIIIHLILFQQLTLLFRLFLQQVNELAESEVLLILLEGVRGKIIVNIKTHFLVVEPSNINLYLHISPRSGLVGTKVPQPRSHQLQSN